MSWIENEKHLFKNIYENWVRKARVYAIWTKTSPSLDPPPCSVKQILFQIAVSKNTGPLSHKQRVSPLDQKYRTPLLPRSHLPFDEAKSRWVWSRGRGSLLLSSLHSGDRGYTVGTVCWEYWVLDHPYPGSWGSGFTLGEVSQEDLKLQSNYLPTSAQLLKEG